MDPTTHQLTPEELIAHVRDLASHESVIDKLREEMGTRQATLTNRLACVAEIRRKFARHTLATGQMETVLIDDKLCLIPCCPKGYGADHEVYPQYSIPIIAPRPT